MNILSYGENAYTFWALNNHMKEILNQLGDSFEPVSCQVLFRPNFGRRAGDDRPQFGEFDFIILSGSTIYLGESMSDRSPGIKKGVMELKEPHCKRHIIFKKYIDSWFQTDFKDWTQFSNYHNGYFTYKYDRGKVYVPIAYPNSQLAKNLHYTLNLIKSHFGERKPKTKNVFLFLHNDNSTYAPESITATDCKFEMVSVDYSLGLEGDSKYVNIR
jgi:hypothetical protein